MMQSLTKTSSFIGGSISDLGLVHPANSVEGKSCILTLERRVLNPGWALDQHDIPK